MRTFRFPIAGLMGAVVVVALGLAALRNSSETWAGVTFVMTCGILCLAIVGVVCRDGAERAWWLGFALFGWGYLMLAMWYSVELPTMALLDAIAPFLGVKAQFSGGMGGGMRSAGLWAFGGFGGGNVGPVGRSLREIVHCLWALVAALLGGLLAHTLFGSSRTRTDRLVTQPHTAPQPYRKWWRGPAVLGAAGCALIVFLGLLGSRWAPGFWAGATFLATCGLLGTAVLGVAGDRGKRRQIWLGAALFGIGYMILAFGTSPDRETWPSLPTDHLLIAVRGWFPPIFSGSSAYTGGVVAANARIWYALEQPVPMPFPEDTPLEDILKYVKAATRGAGFTGIPIYVDPICLQEVEKSMTSTARNIDLEGVALKTSLRLCLKQLDLAFCVRDGFLMITSEESAVTPVYQDPFAIVGHCLLALGAAGIGGIVAPLFCLTWTEDAIL
jgi:hypothetical protein